MLVIEGGLFIKTFHITTTKEKQLHSGQLLGKTTSEPTITRSKLTIETPEQSVKYV